MTTRDTKPTPKRSASAASKAHRAGPAFAMDYTKPQTATSETGTYNNIRFQRYQLAPGVQVNVFEDGRVRVALPSGYRQALTALLTGSSGSSATLSAEQVATQAADSNDEERVRAKALQIIQEMLEGNAPGPIALA